MKYIAYCRKSTDEKDRQVLSIEAQIAELKEFAQREHLEVTEYITEAKTAKIPGREKFKLVLDKIEKGEAQGILSWHPDRLARNSIDGGKVIYLIDTGKILDLKFPSFWFDATPQGKFMLNIAFGQSKYYVDNLSENVKRGIRQKLRMGVWPKQAPMGYLNNRFTKGIDIDPDTYKIVKKAFELFAKGGKSFTEIGKFLYKFKVSRNQRKNKDTPLHINQIKAMLTNRYYVGVFTFKGESYIGSHKCFISKELFKRVQVHINRREKPRKVGHNLPFVGLMRCGECNACITGETHTKKYKNGTNQTFIYYRCTKKLKPCNQKYIPEDDLKEQLINAIQRLGLKKSWAGDWYNWMDKDEQEEKINAEENIKRLQNQIPILDEKLNKLLNSYLDNITDVETYKKKKNEFFEEKLRINEEIEKIKTSSSTWLEPMKEWVGSALSCAKIAHTKNTCHDVALMAKTVSSNLILTNRRLEMNKFL